MSISSPSFHPDRRAFLRQALRISAGLPFADHAARIIDEVYQEVQSRPANAPSAGTANEVCVGFVGLGSRGSHLLRSHGFWPESELKNAGYSTPPQARFPGVRVRAVCDVYGPRVTTAKATLEAYGEKDVMGTRDWRRVVEDPSIQAVIITTADVWHQPIALAAVRAGKDVYVEKCMTMTIEEAKELREAVRASKSVLQVGHQNRHNTYQRIAARLVKEGVLGHVSVVQMALGRNNSEGAYSAAIPPRIAAGDVDWEIYAAKSPGLAFDPDKLINWRKYWAFSTGIAGDLFSHDSDMANWVLGLDFPDSVVASGGVHVWKDGRETPDLYSVVHEYQGKGLTLTYNATLANSFERKTVLLGRDATLVMGFDLNVYPDWGSERYRDQLNSEKMHVDRPFIRFEGPTRGPKLVTSPTLAWAEGKGLTFTDVGGEIADVSRLAVEEFYENVRGRKKPLCDVEEGFKAAVACHLGTKAYRERRTVGWDRKKEAAV